jgi:hypothetical protein
MKNADEGVGVCNPWPPHLLGTKMLHFFYNYRGTTFWRNDDMTINENINYSNEEWQNPELISH